MHGTKVRLPGVMFEGLTRPGVLVIATCNGRWPACLVTFPSTERESRCAVTQVVGSDVHERLYRREPV
jgi:hypothetical protein